MPKQVQRKNKAGTSKAAAAARQARFVEAYISNGENATEAAKLAGYSPKTAYRYGADLLKDPQINKTLADRRAELAQKYRLSTDDVIAELAKLVHADLRKLVAADGSLLPVAQWPDDMAAAIASLAIDEINGEAVSVIGLSKKVQLCDKNASIAKAIKHMG